MSSNHAISLRRLMAFAIDWLVLVLWGGALFGVVALVANGNPPRAASPWQGQLVGLLAMTIPFMLYFALSESSPTRASLGKRVSGLSVATHTGGRLSLFSAVARNTIKFIPWECGHTVAQQAAFSEDRGLATWVWAPAAVAFLCPVWWVLAIVMTAQAPYDRWTSVRVLRSTDVQAFSVTSLAAQQSHAADDRRSGDRG